MSSTAIQDQVDRTLIVDQVFRYMKALDTLDTNLLSSVVTEPFHMHAEQLNLDGPITGDDYYKMGPGVFLPGFDHTAHLIHNAMVSLSGDTAHVHTLLYACHYIKPDDRVGADILEVPDAGIHCNMQMPWEGWLTRQADGGWLFHKIHMDVSVTEGDIKAFDISLERSQSGWHRPKK